MAELMILAFLGHRVGDFLLQPKHWALNKSKSSWICTIHVAVYTISVLAFWQTLDPIVVALVFIPHWVIDRWSLANKWSGLIRGRTFEGAMQSTGVARELDIPFTAVVYKEVDETWHYLCLFATILYILR